MAKKKATARRQPPKRKAAKPTRKPAARRASPKAAAARTKRKGPSPQRLPGVEEDPPIAALEKVCQSIAETREALNDLKQEEAGYEQAALNLMRRNDRTSYQAHGVTLVRVPGEEKLQVKTTRERTATAQTPAEPEEAEAVDDVDGADEGIAEEAD